MQGAKNKLATAEDLSDEDLERLHEEYRKRAEQTLASLTRRTAAEPMRAKRKAALVRLFLADRTEEGRAAGLHDAPDCAACSRGVGQALPSRS